VKDIFCNHYKETRKEKIYKIKYFMRNMKIKKEYSTEEKIPEKLNVVCENLFRYNYSKKAIDAFLEETKKIIKEKTKIPLQIPFEAEYYFEKSKKEESPSINYVKKYKMFASHSTTIVYLDSKNFIGVMTIKNTPEKVLKMSSGKLEKISLNN
jgi:hypothetical protein